MKKLTKLTNAVVFCSFCLLATGCASTKILPPQAPDSGNDEPKDMVNQIIDERSLVKIAVSSANDSELASIICDNAESYLAQNNYAVTKGEADLYLKLKVEESVYDQAGEYVILDGSLSNVLTTNDKSEILARMPELSVRSDRTLGDKAARKEIAKKLSSKLDTWMEKEISPECLGIESRNVSIFLRSRRESKDTNYVTDFINKVEKLDGVLDVTLIKHDINTRNFVINVVFKESEFPTGITNKIMVECPELNLKYK